MAADTAGVQEKLADAIKAAIDDGYTSPDHLLVLAEALAWLRDPTQAH